MKKCRLKWALGIMGCAMATVAMAACSSDKDEPEAEESAALVGIWAEDPTFTEDGNVALEFGSKGSATEYVFNGDTQSETPETMSYAVSGDEIIFSYWGNAKTCQYKLSGTILWLQGFDEDNPTDAMALTKISALP
ncbi:MAG: hypothetical protein LUD17_06495 [Bacteroidales bacterium]|nr:hypothetical protein [Bacteroidales bacterium]